METDVGAAGDGQRQALLQRIGRIAAWVGGVALLLAVLELAGVPVLDWIDDLLDKVAQVPAWAIVAGVTLKLASQPVGSNTPCRPIHSLPGATSKTFS